MPGNVSNTLSGPAMAVLGGIILTIGPWFAAGAFFSKLIISIIGIVLITIGVNN